MNWEKFKFGALLVVLLTCVLAAGWGIRLKGSNSQDSDVFEVITYTSEQSSPLASEHPYSASYDDDQYDHEHEGHHDEEGDDPNIPENEHQGNEHPFSSSYYDDDQEPNEPEDEHPGNEHPSSVIYWNQGE